MITFVLIMAGTVVRRGIALEVIYKTILDVGEKKGIH
jgi:hypothetical protein